MPLFVSATVANASPLTLTFDGDPTTQVPAKQIIGYTPVVGDRVRTEVRTPLPPIVHGKAT